MPGKKIDIVDSDLTGRKLLFTAQNLADPGSLCMWDRDTGRIYELVRRSPLGIPVEPHTTSSIDITDPDGRRLTATLTLPYTVRSRTAPLVVLCPAKPAERALLDYHPEIQALADAGFAVAQVEGYAAANGGRMGFDGEDATKQIDHLLRVVDRLIERFPIDGKRVGLIGRAHGAKLALLAVQSRPDRFRCAVFIDPLASPSSWADAARTRPGSGRRDDLPALVFSSARNTPGTYAATLRGNGFEADFTRLDAQYDEEDFEQVKTVYALIEGFLNEHLYDYEVRMGPLRQLSTP